MRSSGRSVESASQATAAKVARPELSCGFCVYPDTSRLLRRPKLYLPSLPHYWRVSRETLLLKRYSWWVPRERGFKEPRRHPRAVDDVSLVTRATVFGVISMQFETQFSYHSYDMYMKCNRKWNRGLNRKKINVAPSRNARLAQINGEYR